MLNEECLLPLLKARKKKYIRKLLEYAIAIPSPHAMPPLLATPISEQCAADLDLSSEQCQALICTLVHLIDLSLAHAFQFQGIFSAQFDGSLKDCLVDLLLSLREDIVFARRSPHATALIDLEWSVDLEVANSRGKCNRPIVRLELVGGSQRAIERKKIEMNREAFGGLYGALRAIKDHMGGRK